jgi:hypothetical protein
VGHSWKYPGSISRNPSPPLLYDRNDRYLLGKAKSQPAVSVAIAFGEAGWQRVQEAETSLKISRRVFMASFSRRGTEISGAANSRPRLRPERQVDLNRVADFFQSKAKHLLRLRRE